MPILKWLDIWKVIVQIFGKFGNKLIWMKNQLKMVIVNGNIEKNWEKDLKSCNKKQIVGIQTQMILVQN